MKQAIFTATTLVILSSPAFSEGYSEAYGRFCDKLKSCALSELEQESAGMDDAMKQMIKQQLEGMCVGIEQSFGSIKAYPDLEESAVACFGSLSELSCETLTNSKGPDVTPQCAALKRESEKFSSGN